MSKPARKVQTRNSAETRGRDAAGAPANDAKEPTANEWRRLVRERDGVDARMRHELRSGLIPAPARR